MRLQQLAASIPVGGGTPGTAAGRFKEDFLHAIFGQDDYYKSHLIILFDQTSAYRFSRSGRFRNGNCIGEFLVDRAQRRDVVALIGFEVAHG